jgi:hypothetical protein
MVSIQVSIYVSPTSLSVFHTLIKFMCIKLYEVRIIIYHLKYW